MITAVLTPAYGRDYLCAADAERDFHAGRDFRFQPTGQYCSIRDFSGMDIHIEIRYNRLRDATVVRIEE